MRITPEQRRARLGRRHLLTSGARAATTEEVARTLVGLHATDAASVTLSARARLRDPSPQDVERALYEDRTLLRMHCMRRTLFAVPTELAPVFHFSTAQAVAARERAAILKRLTAADPDWDADWLAAAEEAALEAVGRLGEPSLTDLLAEVPVLRESVTISPGKPYESRQRVGGWVLRLLAMDGRIRRGRPLGGWSSSQFRYGVAPELAPMDVAEAKAEVVRSWLACYGPGTTTDLKWWTGWTVADVRAALERVGAAEVALAEGAGWTLPGDADAPPESADEPWAALLPGLDPATMGWKQRDWYLDPALVPLLFDTAGNGGPAVWFNGEIVGAWAQRRDGEVVWRLLADRGAEARRTVEAEAARLQSWLAEHRLVVSFPAPLSKELTA
ncbi:winged helix DNA-binding domain-containing protein [Streptomyces sp. NPDC051907]|uniref:winged helix DNA-binding domain-containing protein n=1 Tax=Streptomyces sp. NPDC051907 TaxID=3155284 RepID=UPI00341A0594